MSRSRRILRRIRLRSIEEFEARLCLSSVSFIGHDIATEGLARVYPVDVDTDGDLDLLIASWFDGLAWFENVDGRGTFSDAKVISRNVSRPDLVIAEDLDADGDADVLLYEHHPVYAVSWYENLDGIFGGPKIIHGGLVNSLEVADLDGDGDSDVLVSDDDICIGRIWWYENVDAQFVGRTLESSFPNPLGDPNLSVASNTGADPIDFDGDGDVDILATPCLFPYGTAITWHDNVDNSQGFVEYTVVEQTERFLRDLTTADVDNDGDMDLVAASSSDVIYYKNLGMERFAGEPTIIDTQTDPGIVFWSVFGDDLDDDGDQDILAMSLDQGVLWYENTDGNGTFAAPRVVNRGSSTTSISVADIDGDGDSDVVSAVIGRIIWSEKIISPIGDSNRDMQFDQQDIVHVLKAGKYLTGEAAGFEDGDWNGDRVFDQRDIAAALQAGTYFRRPKV